MNNKCTGNVIGRCDCGYCVEQRTKKAVDGTNKSLSAMEQRLDDELIRNNPEIRHTRMLEKQVEYLTTELGKIQKPPIYQLSESESISILTSENTALREKVKELEGRAERAGFWGRTCARQSKRIQQLEEALIPFINYYRRSITTYCAAECKCICCNAEQALATEQMEEK